MVKMHAVWVLIVCLSLAVGAKGKEVVFGSRVFDVATESECLDHNYDDPKNTGSQLFSQKGGNSGMRTLSMDVQLVHYGSASAQCFRAHPVFVTCMQTALSKLKSAKKRALVFGGYRLPSEIGSSTAPEDVFAAAGTAMYLLPQSRDPNDLLDIAKHILHYCPTKMEQINRNIGIVMKADSLHVFMGGPTDPPVFKADGYTVMSEAAFVVEALHAINVGLEMGKQMMVCSRLATLTSGQWYPVNATSADNAVGAMDTPVTREDAEDFDKLVMYLGTAVQFENSERSAAWCGQPSRSACVDCRAGPLDVTLDKRCTARMMTSRMSNVLTLLQMLSYTSMGDSILVTQAWDEDYDGYTAPATSLHREGRAVLVKLASGNTANLNALSQLAICADADYVQHNGDHLLIAVQKQHGGTASETVFAQAEMVRVEPPTSKAYMVALPNYFTETDLAAFPVFDSYGREDMVVASHTTLGMFRSTYSRYLRLNTFVADCFSKLQDYFVKREELDGVVTLEVLRGFLTSPQRDVTFTPTDHRYASGVLGLSFEVRANASMSSSNVTLASLARLAVTQCTPIFNDYEDSQIGVGLYHDRVYVDIRDSYKFWNPSGAFTSHVQSSTEFQAYMQSLFDAAYDGRIIEPDVPTEAAVLAEPPERQSISYRYVTPESIHRRRESGVAAGECVPNTATEFCQESKPFRDRLLNDWWMEVAKKHNYRDEVEVKRAFDKCFGECGTCTSGSPYEDKLEHCSNFLHWSSFEMVLERTAINLFPRERPEMRKCACQGSAAHCIEDSALFLLVVNMFEATYRPDPDSSVVVEMYEQTENPSPVSELVNQIYAIHHEGVAKIWVEDETDIAAMRLTLEKLMVYNPNVTEVLVYVNETSARDGVDTVLRSLILDWTTSASPLYSREFVAPYTILELEPHCRITSKRSAQQHSERERMISKMHANDYKELYFDI